MAGFSAFSTSSALAPAFKCHKTHFKSSTSFNVMGMFHDNFHVKNYTNGEKAPHFALASALELHEGSPEE
ncbi:DNA repair protein complementing XP-C cells, partial [Trifolium medium]|nr:DNA repair protein complementing XP-C cells [Trifolium medium]